MFQATGSNPGKELPSADLLAIKLHTLFQPVMITKDVSVTNLELEKPTAHKVTVPTQTLHLHLILTQLPILTLHRRRAHGRHGRLCRRFATTLTTRTRTAPGQCTRLTVKCFSLRKSSFNSSRSLKTTISSTESNTLLRIILLA